MEPYRTIDAAFLDTCARAWAGDEAGHRVADALAGGTLHDVALDHTAAARLPFVFSIDLDPQGVTDQGQSLRCWAFAFLNVARHNAVRTLDMQDRSFELSQCYIYFYDQLEKSARFLDRMIRCAGRPLGDRAVQRELREPISDYGYLSFLMLAEKYGAVPKSVMPDTCCLPDTRPVTRILSMKLRWCARRLRQMHESGCGDGDLQAEKMAMLRDIYRILCRFLGEPPRQFDFAYRDSGGGLRRLCGITPQQFFAKYCGIDPAQYVEVRCMPGDKTPFGERYYQPDEPGGPLPPDARISLNLCMADIKAAVIAQLRAGVQVTFGSDVAKLSSKPRGLMDTDLFHYEELFGTELWMDSPDSYAYHWSSVTHIMCFDGVELDAAGAPVRWKVQNSYGAGMGIQGHYVMADRWFDQFVVSAALRRDFLPAHVLPWLDKEPRPLE